MLFVSFRVYFSRNVVLSRRQNRVLFKGKKRKSQAPVFLPSDHQDYQRRSRKQAYVFFFFNSHHHMIIFISLLILLLTSLCRLIKHATFHS